MDGPKAKEREGEKKEKAKSLEEKEKDQKEIDKVVEEMALFEIKQRKKDGLVLNSYFLI